HLGTTHGSGKEQKLSSGTLKHPTVSSQPSIVQSMLSLQFFGANWHRPVIGSQLSSVQRLLSSQLTGLQANTVVVVVVVVGVLVVGVVAGTVVVVVLVVEVVVVTTTATRSSTQFSTSPRTVGESVVLWQSLGAFAWSFAKQPFVGSRPPVYFAIALS